MENYKEKYENLIEKLKKAKEEHGGYTFSSVIDKIVHELRESEDEQHRKWILEYLYDGLQKSDEQFKDQFNSAIAWLEKQGEQRYWSEEDDSRICQIIDWLSICKTYNPDQKSVCDISMQIAWLKSIKPNHWKPSEKQMEALKKECIAHSNYQLCRLLEELEKL